MLPDEQGPYLWTKPRDGILEAGSPPRDAVARRVVRCQAEAALLVDDDDEEADFDEDEEDDEEDEEEGEDEVDEDDDPPRESVR
ncbi:hypothetical protein [Xylanimonas sp. McL0601]|uniref:hypothetical protein n=1 Tax=Xylanimonas sp. McL0601 TaxID=3414739 RepID=UPI003CFBA422